MKPGTTRTNAKTRAKSHDRIARSVSFLALAALLAMATLSDTSAHRDIAASGTTHWSGPWHG
jgi:hypothetical protein